MFDHRHFRIFAFEDVPLDQDIYLMSDKWMDEYEGAMIGMFNGGEYPIVGYISYAAARHATSEAIELSWYPNIHDRFHKVKVVLPRYAFITCVDSYDYDEKPHIFVADAWLQHLFLRSYSVFVMIDAIGIKRKLLAGGLERDSLIKLREEVDALAERHPDLAFISFADSLVVKGNWSVGTYDSTVKYTYRPEIFVRIVPELQTIYHDVLDLEIYAVLTQGVNEYYEDAPTHTSRGGNHISLNSLGLPFAQLMAIEKAARRAIHDGEHQPHELYIDEDFYNSLRFVNEFNKTSKPKARYRDPMTSGDGLYFYSDCRMILDSLSC